MGLFIMVSPNTSIIGEKEIKNDIPCFNCPVRDKCSKGNRYDPITCELLDEWIYSLIKDKYPIEKIPLYLIRIYGTEEEKNDPLSR